MVGAGKNADWKCCVLSILPSSHIRKPKGKMQYLTSILPHVTPSKAWPSSIFYQYFSLTEQQINESANQQLTLGLLLVLSNTTIYMASCNIKLRL